MSDDLKGRCVSCGFLGLVFRYDHKHANQYLYEACQAARDKGSLRTILPHVGVGASDAKVVCIVGAVADLDEQIKDREDKWQRKNGHMNDETGYRLALEIINEDRKCPAWKRYHEGLGPREHMVMEMFEDMRERDRKWQLELEKGRKRFEFIIAVVLGSLAAGNIIAAIIAPFISRQPTQHIQGSPPPSEDASHP